MNVHPNYFGHGAGKLLMNEIIRVADEQQTIASGL